MHSAPPSMPPRWAKCATPCCRPVTPKNSSSRPYTVTNSHAGIGMGGNSRMMRCLGKYQAKASSTPNTPPEAPITSSCAPEPLCTSSCVDRKSTRLNSSHGYISYAVFCLKKKKKHLHTTHRPPCPTHNNHIPSARRPRYSARHTPHWQDRAWSSHPEPTSLRRPSEITHL